MRRASRGQPLRPLLRALAVLVTSGLAVCGVKGPPRPPEAPQAESSPDAGAIVPAPAVGAADAGTRP